MIILRQNSGICIESLAVFPTSDIRVFWVFNEKFVRVEQIALKTYRRFHLEVHIRSLSIWICFH